MALLASGTYLEDKNMAVMNPMGGGIDSAVTQRMQRMQNDPNALGQQAQKSGDILDLIAARRAADLVAEQKKLLALQMNGSPSTIKDQVGEELVASQKEQMKGPLQDLRGRAQGVGGVLQNQQRQQQMQGAPTMAAAQGGIINAPAPNLTRMYNGGIVGYAKGGLTRDEVTAYLKEVGITEAEFEDEPSEVQERIVAGINKKIAEDRDLGTARDKRLLSPFGGADMQDRRRQIGEFFTAPFRSDPTGEELKQGRKEFNPTERQDAAKRRMNLPDTTIADIRGPLVNEVEFGERIAGMPGREQFDQQVAKDTDMYAADEATTGTTDTGTEEGKTGVEPEENKPTSAVKQLEDKVNKGFDPFASATTGAGAGAGAGAGIAGIAGIKPNGTVPSGGPVPQQSPLMTPQQQAEARPKPKTPVELLQERLDKMDGKKGIAGLVERFANTDFQKSYGGTGEALAQAGRDIAKTGKDEKAANRKFLEGQLGVQQSIEAADVAAGRDREKFDITEGRLSETMTAANKNAVADIALRAEIAQRDSLNNLAKLNLDTVNSKGAQDYRMAALELQKQENTIREQGNTTAVQNVVRGYVTAATSFYKGLLANATQAEATAIKQELRAEIGRIVGMVGTDGVIDLSVLMRDAGAAPTDNEFSMKKR